ncbi:MAG TPA: CHASE3 domain-containing protein, partial [Chitinophagaceae bacterium]|nr:CHASE3 domain-containing protein [Chitinophagaceae bacterium]
MKKNLNRVIGLSATIITMFIAIMVMIGWFIHNDFLRALVPGQVKMKFNVALGFMFSSIVLLFHYFRKESKIWYRISILLSVVISLIGALTLTEYIFGYNLGIDELFARDELPTTAIYYAGRMSPISAINFLLIGIGLFLLNKEKTATYQFYYLFGIAFVSLLMLIGFNFITDIPTFIRLAIHVAVGFITLTAAIFFAQPILHKKISFERKLITGFIAAIILLLVISTFSSYYNKEHLNTSNLVEHTNKVLNEAEQTLSITKDFESGSRGYVITGDSDYLEHFNVAKNTIISHIKKLKELTKDNPLQQSRIDSLSVLIDKRISFSQQSVQLRNEKGVEAASKLIATKQGKYYMDKIRNLIAEIQLEENNLLTQRQKANVKNIAAFNRASVTFLATVFILLVIIFFAIRYNSVKRKKAEEKITYQAKMLEDISDAIFSFDVSFIITSWNKAAELFYDISSEEAIGKAINEIIF